MRQEAIELIVALKGHTLPKGAKNAYNRLCKAIEQPAQQQEPVANISIWHKNGEQHAELWNWDKGIETLPDGNYDLYTTPPANSMNSIKSSNTLDTQRKPLTDEEILTVARNHYNSHQRAEISFARAIEAAHGIKE